MVGKRHQGSRPCRSLVYLRQIGTIIPEPELLGHFEGDSLILFNHNLLACPWYLGSMDYFTPIKVGCKSRK